MAAEEKKKESKGMWYLGVRYPAISRYLEMQLADDDVNELVAEQLALEQIKKRGCPKGAKLFLVWVKELTVD